MGQTAQKANEDEEDQKQIKNCLGMRDWSIWSITKLKALQIINHWLTLPSNKLFMAIAVIAEFDVHIFMNWDQWPFLINVI